MPTQAIQNLEITNFKCFKDFKISGIGRVNLIGGKNNIGKTAFLEAVELFLSSSTASELAFMTDNLLRKRQNELALREIDFFYKKEKTLTLISATKQCQISWLKTDDAKISLDSSPFLTDALFLSVATDNTLAGKDSESTTIPFDVFVKPDSKGFTRFDLRKITNKKFSYISSAKSDEQDIAILLGALIDSDREDFLNQSLSLFDSNILSVKQVTTQLGVTLKLKLKNQDNLVLLSSLGEGVNRFLAILCAIWANKDGFLLIDEIENGIHYTNYKKLWEIIFEASISANCQLFVTTHSKECIQAFNDVQFENEKCNAQYLEFYKNLKTGLIDASGIDKEQLRYSLTHEGRVRGE
jgi:AAA15 family ATPase/GTPase